MVKYKIITLNLEGEKYYLAQFKQWWMFYWRDCGKFDVRLNLHDAKYDAAVHRSQNR